MTNSNKLRIAVALAEGRRAALRGHNPGYNPFRWEDEERLHEAWNRGWVEGRSEEVKAHRYTRSGHYTLHTVAFLLIIANAMLWYGIAHNLAVGSVNVASAAKAPTVIQWAI